jgi:hypothetical protein
VVLVPAGFHVKPVDQDEVAARLVELALGEPAGRAPDIAGPLVTSWADLLRDFLRAGHRRAGWCRCGSLAPAPSATARSCRGLATPPAAGPGSSFSPRACVRRRPNQHRRRAISMKATIEGMAVVRYTAVTLCDGTRRFSGVLSVTGRIGDRGGSFVLEDQGTGSTQETNARWTVVRGSATGELVGLTGDGGWHWEVGRQDEAYTLSYELAVGS